MSAYAQIFGAAYGWATLRLYNEFAWAYDPISSFVGGGRWDAWRRLALDHVKGPRVLELGFGTGELLIAMCERRLRPVGLDLSRAMHRVTARKLTSRGLTVPRLLARAERLPFASRSFDSVLSTFPAGYIAEKPALTEIARVLAPGGRLVIGALTVQIPRSLRYPLSVVPGGSWDRFWGYFAGVCQETGLAASVAWRDDGPARVPVIVCELVAEASHPGPGSM
jgi:SAM-dependent methyltransferase